MIGKPWLLALAVLTATASTSLVAQNLNSGLRGATPLNEEGPAAPMMPMRNTAEKETRNYPEQPPVIPHSIDGYQIDINGNKCLSCHARARTAESQAPMVSITHFMDRDGQFLGSVSPRRFFCTSCHVPQNTAVPPVTNDFVDIDTMLSKAAPGGRR
jgi:cytochrome c-type protein NapB